MIQKLELEVLESFTRISYRYLNVSNVKIFIANLKLS